MEVERSWSKGCNFFCASNCIFTASVQPWQEFHPWLAGIARFDDNPDVEVKERNKNSDLRYWVQWGRTGLRRAERIKSSVLNIFTEMPHKNPKEML